MDWAAFAGWGGAIIGTLLGFAGGAFGTWCTLRSAQGPRERAFLVRASIVIWIAVLGFLAAVLFLPAPYKHLIWAPYILGLMGGVRLLNRRIEQIRREESHAAPPAS